MLSMPSPKTEDKRLLVNIKKKNISATNDLPKLTKSIFVWLIICLICTEFYPISQYVIGNRFIDDFSTSLNFISKKVFF